MADQRDTTGFSRRQFLGRTGALAIGGALSRTPLSAQGQRPVPEAAGADRALLLVNGRIHTMDQNKRIVSQALIRNGRFAGVGNNVAVRGASVRRIDLKQRTVIPGLIDAHNHIVLVGNRPGWHTPLEHVFTIPEAIDALKARSAGVPAAEFITTVGPISAMQFAERRLPELAELDAVPTTRVHPGRARRREDERPGKGVA